MIPKIYTFVKTPEPEPKENEEDSEEEESEYEESEQEEVDDRNQSLLEIAEFIRSTGERFMDYVGWKKQTAVLPLFPIPTIEEEEEEDEDEEEGEEEEEEEEDEEDISEIEGNAQDIEISKDISMGKSPGDDMSDTMDAANKTMFQPDLHSQDDEEREWKFGHYYNSLSKIDEGLTSSALILKCMLNQIEKDDSDGVSNIQNLDIEDLLFKQLDDLEFK